MRHVSNVFVAGQIAVQVNRAIDVVQGRLPFDGFFKVLAKQSSSLLPGDQVPHRMAKMAMSLAALDELGRQGMEPVQDDQVQVNHYAEAVCRQLLHLLAVSLPS